MTVQTTRRFRAAFATLPEAARRSISRGARTLLEHPGDPALQFKPIHPLRPVFSARVALGYIALGVKEGQDVIWFWVGSHADYDRLLAQAHHG